MGTIEATVSMLETMPEEARLLVFNYTQELFSAQRPANPFTPISTDKLEALREMGKQHGFI